MNWPLIRHRVFWFGLAALFGAKALFDCYNMGYDNAKWTYERREFDLKDRHLAELLVQMKQRASPNQRLFEALTIGDPYDDASKSLREAKWEMMDYLTPHGDDTYDSHWIDREGETKERQTWITLTNNKKTHKLVSKEMMIRRTPGSEKDVCR